MHDSSLKFKSIKCSTVAENVTVVDNKFISVSGVTILFLFFLTI